MWQCESVLDAFRQFFGGSPLLILAMIGIILWVKTQNENVRIWACCLGISAVLLVYNEISFDLIREAAQSGKRVQDFFSHLDSGCTQYLIDIDTPEFKGNLDSFMSRKADFENCNAKTMRELKKAAGIVPEKSHTDKDFER